MRSLPQLSPERRWEFEVDGRACQVMRNRDGSLFIRVQNARGSWWEVPREVTPEEMRAAKYTVSRQIEAGLAIRFDLGAEPPTWHAFRPGKRLSDDPQGRWLRNARYLGGQQWVSLDEMAEIRGEVVGNPRQDALDDILAAERADPRPVVMTARVQASRSSMTRAMVLRELQRKPAAPLVRVDAKRGYFED